MSSVASDAFLRPKIALFHIKLLQETPGFAVASRQKELCVLHGCTCDSCSCVHESHCRLSLGFAGLFSGEDPIRLFPLTPNSSNCAGHSVTIRHRLNGEDLF